MAPVGQPADWTALPQQEDSAPGLRTGEQIALNISTCSKIFSPLQFNRKSCNLPYIRAATKDSLLFNLQIVFNLTNGLIVGSI